MREAIYKHYKSVVSKGFFKKKNPCHLQIFIEGNCKYNPLQ